MTERMMPKQQRGIDTRTKIIEAANAIYEDAGRDYLKMQDVQKSSGLSIGTVYRYFSDRGALLEAVGTYRVEKGLEEAPVAVQAAPQEDSTAMETVDAIKRWCQRVIDVGEGRGDLKVAGTFILSEIEKRGL